MNFIYFYERLPKTKLRQLGIDPTFKAFDFTVLHYADTSTKVWYYEKYKGGFRVQFTKLPHGFLFDDTTHMAMLLADYNNTRPDAVIKVDDDDVEWLERGGYNDVTKYHFRKFIASRLVNFDDNHTV